MNYKTLLLAATAAALLISGCETDRGTKLQDSLVGNTVEDNIAGYAVFNPTEGKIPYPNNILYAPNSSSTNDPDGVTLNIPYEPTDADAGIKEQLNELTGFSTISPITAPITANLDVSTIASGVQVYDVNMTQGAVTAINKPLKFGTDFYATQSGSNIAILPLVPLASNHNYMVVLTNDLKDTHGRVLAPDIATALTLGSNPVTPGGSLDEQTAAALEKIRQGNKAMFAALVADGKNPSNTVQIWNFHTQLIGAVQQNIAAHISNASTIVMNNAGLTTKDLFGKLGIDTSTMKGSAQIYAGQLRHVPQYMPQATKEDPTNAFIGQFDVNKTTFSPKVQADINLPIVVTIPDSASGCPTPANNAWPVVIYQHGITRVRTDLFAYGETFAARCYAAVAIDLPLHGITESNTTINPFYMGKLERTFNIDAVTEDEHGNIIDTKPDGVIDSSGSHYINLTHIATTRDNLHQTTSDLLELESALSRVMDLNGTNIKFDTSNIHLVAHSLGTIASTGYINQTTALTTITLAMPGQGLAQLLNNSMRYGPIIEAGLAQKGIMRGTAAYESFMIATQTITDDADPANYTISVGKHQAAPILAFEVIGSDVPTVPCSGVAADSDNVIPNCVPTAPLSGTDPYLTSIQASDINMTDGTAGLKPIHGNTMTRLTKGAHASPLYPDEVTLPIHAQIISFISSKGAFTKVVDPSIVYQP